MTEVPLTELRLAGRQGMALVVHHLTSKVGIAGPQLAGLSTKKSPPTAVMIPEVSVIP